MGEKDIAWIDAFINGELDDNELNKFNERRKSDAEFNKEVELLLSIGEGYERMELKEQMQELEEGFKAKVDTYGIHDKASASEMPLRKRHPLRWMAIAAGIAVLISTPFIIQQFNDSPDIKDGKMKYGIPQDTISPKDSIKDVDVIIPPKHIENKEYILKKMKKLKSKRIKAYDKYIRYRFYAGHKGDTIKLRTLKENYEKLDNQLNSFELEYSDYINDPDSLINY